LAFVTGVDENYFPLALGTHCGMGLWHGWEYGSTRGPVKCKGRGTIRLTITSRIRKKGEETRRTAFPVAKEGGIASESRKLFGANYKIHSPD
jgi:hypothetical protein